MKDIRKHVLITGTGRAGTTFLVELLTNLGFATGFTADEIKKKKNKLGRAGLEHRLLSPNCPYIVKDPWFCDYAAEALEREDVAIEHIFIPIRNLSAAAESRRFVTREGLKKKPLMKRIAFFLGKKMEFPGGLWHTRSLKKNAQEIVLLNQLYKLLLPLSEYHIPTTFIRYPRSVQDGQYLFEKLKPVLRDIDLTTFLDAHAKTARPDLVHQFNDDDK